MPIVSTEDPRAIDGRHRMNGHLRPEAGIASVPTLREDPAPAAARLRGRTKGPTARRQTAVLPATCFPRAPGPLGLREVGTGYGDARKADAAFPPPRLRSRPHALGPPRRSRHHADAGPTRFEHPPLSKLTRAGNTPFPCPDRGPSIDSERHRSGVHAELRRVPEATRNRLVSASSAPHQCRHVPLHGMRCIA